jgi:uncharacterized protein YkwD
MRKQTLLLLAGLCLVLAVSIVPSSSQAQSLGVPSIQSGSDVLAIVNSLRASNGLPPYAANSILMQIAQAQADYLAATGGSNGHTGPGGTRPIDRATAAGYPAAFFSENWWSGSGLSPAGVVSAWQGDAPHLNTMLSPQYVDAGVGVSKSASIVYYVLDVGSTGSSASGVTPGPGTTVAAAASTSGPSQFMVPVTVSTPGADGLVYHEVAYGQSLWSIAIAYGVKIDDIKSLNNLSGLDIYPGQKLLILRGPTPAPASPTATMADASTQAPETSAAPELTESNVVLEVSLVPSVELQATPSAPMPQKQLNLTAIAIIAAALLFAGFGTWAGMRRTDPQPAASSAESHLPPPSGPASEAPQSTQEVPPQTDEKT